MRQMATRKSRWFITNRRRAPSIARCITGLRRIAQAATSRPMGSGHITRPRLASLSTTGPATFMCRAGELRTRRATCRRARARMSIEPSSRRPCSCQGRPRGPPTSRLLSRFGLVLLRRPLRLRRLRRLKLMVAAPGRRFFCLIRLACGGAERMPVVHRRAPVSRSGRSPAIRGISTIIYSTLGGPARPGFGDGDELPAHHAPHALLIRPSGGHAVGVGRRWRRSLLG